MSHIFQAQEDGEEEEAKDEGKSAAEALEPPAKKRASFATSN